MLCSTFQEPNMGATRVPQTAASRKRSWCMISYKPPRVSLCRDGKPSAGGETVVGEGVAGLAGAEGLTTGWWRGLPWVGGTAETTGLVQEKTGSSLSTETESSLSPICKTKNLSYLFRTCWVPASSLTKTISHWRRAGGRCLGESVRIWWVAEEKPARDFSTLWRGGNSAESRKSSGRGRGVQYTASATSVSSLGTERNPRRTRGKSS